MNMVTLMSDKINENPFKSLTNIMYEILIEKIVSYDYVPNSKLSVAELTDELSISKTPVKKAIEMLEADGFVYTVKNKGTFFSPFVFSDYVNFLKLRASIEAGAVSKAVFNMNASDLKQVSNYLNDLFFAYDQANYSLIFSSEENFHSFIVKCSKNQYIIDAYNDLAIYNKHFRIYVAIDKSHYKITKDYHRIICDSLHIKDQKLCETAMKNHLEIGLELLPNDNNNIELMQKLKNNIVMN